MPIDSSIALQVKPVQLPDPINSLARVLQIQAAQGQNQLQQYTLSRAQRQDEGMNRLSQLLQGGGVDLSTPEGQAKAFQAYPEGAPAMIKNFMEGRRLASDIGKNDADTVAKRTSLYRDQLANVSTPNQAPGWLKAQYDDPLLGPVLQRMQPFEQAVAQIPQDPAQFAQWRNQQSLGMTKFLELNKPTTTVVNAGGTSQVLQTPGLGGAPQPVAQVQHTVSPDAVLSAQTSRANNAATVGATIRGQDMTDKRSREQIAQGRVPSGYRLAADGVSLEFIPGGPADPETARRAAPTEFQGKSATYGARAEEADKILTELTGKYSPLAVNTKEGMSKVWGVGGGLEAGANALLSPEAQRAEQAQRNFLNAVLRQESGAAIAQSEFDNGKRQYFPQPGDSPAVIAQKAQNRKTAIMGFKQNAGRAAFTAPGGGVVDFHALPSGGGKVVDFGSLR